MNAALFVCNLLSLATYIGFSWYWVDSTSGWWRSLRKPAWQPPDWVFGTIWPYNFLMLAVASFALATSGTDYVLWTLTFAESVLASVWWGYEFYRSRNFVRASVALGITALSTFPMMTVLWLNNTLMFWLLMPYQVWLLTATSLCVGLYWLNQRTKSI